jgi:hypothetical protein
LAVQAYIKKRGSKKEVIQISVSYDTIKKNKTLGDFTVKSEEDIPDKELPTLE